MLYNDSLDGIGDPHDSMNTAIGIGDKRAGSWFDPFGNMPERRGLASLPPGTLERLAMHHPDLAHAAASTATGDAAPQPTSPARVLFERLVGLAQRRFFDVACAVAMADTLKELLTAVVGEPSLPVDAGWCFDGQRALAERRELLVDRDFVLQGARQSWRLRADFTDAQAREWALALLADAAARLLETMQHGGGMLHVMRGVAPPPVPAELAGRGYVGQK